MWSQRTERGYSDLSGCERVLAVVQDSVQRTLSGSMVVSSSPEESKGSGDSTTFDEGIQRARFWADPKILGYATFFEKFQTSNFFLVCLVIVSAVRISAHRKYPLAKDLIFGHGLTPSTVCPPSAQRQGNSNSDHPLFRFRSLRLKPPLQMYCNTYYSGVLSLPV